MTDQSLTGQLIWLVRPNFAGPMGQKSIQQKFLAFSLFRIGLPSGSQFNWLNRPIQSNYENNDFNVKFFRLSRIISLDKVKTSLMSLSYLSNIYYLKAWNFKITVVTLYKVCRISPNSRRAEDKGALGVYIND